MTPHTLASVLEDLYAIDPALRAHEAQLVPLVELLLRNDPSGKPDEAFVERLRGELRQHAVVLSEDARDARGFSWFSSFPLRGLSAALGGALFAVVLAVPATYYALRGVQVPSMVSAPVFSSAVRDAGQRG